MTMIMLCTDFGTVGPYVGQMKAVLYQKAPDVPVIELISDLPVFDPQSSAYLLASFVEESPAGTVFLGVVDPGVGSSRKPIVLKADQRWFVGPDNGLFALVARRATQVEQWEVLWRPERLSASFHGRDLFSPIAASIALGELFEQRKMAHPQNDYKDWPDDLFQVIYLDHFGNAITGIRANRLADNDVLRAGGKELVCASTFSDLPIGSGFWYRNANGLVELSINRGSAVEMLGLSIGAAIDVC